MAVLVALAATLLAGGGAAAAAPVPGDVIVSDTIVAQAGPLYGGQLLTRCTIQVKASYSTEANPVAIRYSGTNRCSRSLYQGGQARLLTETRAIDDIAPAFRFALRQSGISQRLNEPVGRGLERIVQHHTTVFAPFGQIWKVVPEGCYGMNTPRLTCTLERPFLV
ncbi:hypothetical protein [Allokutzneria albata]|nr:hypothetical protein [Allokutzneria albata]